MSMATTAPEMAYQPTTIAWWRNLSQNPIYQREKGRWGEANPYYGKFKRYAPFFILGAILLGLCAGYSNPTFLTAGNGLGAIWCLLCLPSMAQNIITWLGSVMAGVVTAPSVCLERTNGTWEILRLVPQSPQAILLAKLFGSLARLQIIWIALFFLTVIQAIVLLFTGLFIDQLGLGSVVALFALIRPWQDILFTALWGMTLSTWTKSVTVALAGTFAGLLVMKLLSGLSWIMVIWASPAEQLLLILPVVWPVLLYGLAIVILLALLPGRATTL